MSDESPTDEEDVEAHGPIDANEDRERRGSRTETHATRPRRAPMGTTAHGRRERSRTPDVEAHAHRAATDID